MAELPKRLTPTSEVVRRLFLHSGNCCAFPGCERRIMNAQGEFIAQMCHIEAAEPGGERFNEKMNNEDRRAFENLILLCHEHHVLTNNVNEYRTERMKRMKADHEAIYADPTERIIASFLDATEGVALRPPTSLQHINDLLNWKETPEESQATADEYFVPLCEGLKKVPRRAKEILAVILRRGKNVSGFRTGDHFEVLYVDLREALEATDYDLQEQLRILEHHDLAHFLPDEEEGKHLVATRSYDWELWESLVLFCKRANIQLEQIIVYGDFTLLDSPKQ